MTITADHLDVQNLSAGFAERSVDINGFSVRYWEKGEGEALVVLHGAGGPEFSIPIALFAEKRRVIVVEMPGYGDTVNDVHQNLEELAEAVTEAVQNIGIERYHLMGTSFGGATAALIAIAHSDRLISVVLDAPALFREGAGDPSAGSPEQMLRNFRANPAREPHFAGPDPERMQRTWPMVQRLLAERNPRDEAVIEKLGSVTVRTLVLFGDRDGIIPPENGRIYRRYMPNCSLIFIYGAAHAAQFDRPEAFADVVGDFLDRGWHFLLPEESTVINP